MSSFAVFWHISGSMSFRKNALCSIDSQESLNSFQRWPRVMLDVPDIAIEDAYTEKQLNSVRFPHQSVK